MKSSISMTGLLARSSIKPVADGQRFRASGRGEQSGQVNLRYGNEPGMLFYTHISDQYTPFYTKVIAANARDATHVLDGLLYHESDLRIEEHYTDTAGFTDHVFALCHLLGFRFAPRIRDLADKRLYVPGKERDHPTLAPLIGGTLNLKLARTQWEEILRLAASIRHGTVTASLIIRKLASYPRQNSLGKASGRRVDDAISLSKFQLAALAFGNAHGPQGAIAGYPVDCPVTSRSRLSHGYGR